MIFSVSLLRLLSDGQFYSGTELGVSLGCSRTAVWKMIQGLEDAGVEIFHVKGKGYRLACAVELLDEELISMAMSADALRHLSRLDVLFSVASTNAHLLAEELPAHNNGRACLAELQSDGRGRRGKSWVSPFGGNIYLSLRWRFQCGAARLGGLSLSVGVAVANALRRAGLEGVGLKWPNDIYLQQKKLAGVLLEISGEATGPCEVVIGIGINVCSTESARNNIDQPWSDIESYLGKRISRNKLAGQLLSELIETVRRYDDRGWPAFRQAWQALDIYSGQEVVLHTLSGETMGISRGVDDNGALVIISENGEEHRYHSGEVSLRAVTRSPNHA